MASASYSAYEHTSAITSTSVVGRVAAAAGSVINSPVTHPPTNTTSSSMGSRSLAPNNSRLGSGMSVSYAFCDLTRCEVPLSSTTVSQRVQQGQQLVEVRIRSCCERGRPVQRSKRYAAMLTCRQRPHRREVPSGRNLTVQRWCRVRGQHAARDVTANRREHVLHPVDEELFHSLAVRPTVARIVENESRRRQSRQSCVDLGRAENQIDRHPHQRRASPGVAQQLGQHDNVLG